MHSIILDDKLIAMASTLEEAIDVCKRINIGNFGINAIAKEVEVSKFPNELFWNVTCKRDNWSAFPKLNTEYPATSIILNNDKFLFVACVKAKSANEAIEIAKELKKISIIYRSDIQTKQIEIENME